MAKHFEFADFVEEFKLTFYLIVMIPGKYLPNGQWQKPQEDDKRPMEGIILPLSKDDLQYSANGVYEEQDRKLYLLEPLNKGDVLEYKGQRYTVFKEMPYSDYADVFIYHCRGDTK